MRRLFFEKMANVANAANVANTAHRLGLNCVALGIIFRYSC
jgi:hypothetical protein